MSTEKIISADQIKKHQAHGDLWLALHGNVYNVSEFMDDHPGGAHALLDQAGIDATGAFENVGHSTDARALMEGFKIGRAGDMVRLHPFVACLLPVHLQHLLPFVLEASVTCYPIIEKSVLFSVNTSFLALPPAGGNASRLVNSDHLLCPPTGADIRTSSADFMKLQQPGYSSLSKICALAVASLLVIWLLASLK